MILIGMDKKNKPYNSNKWTVARFNSFIKSGLRILSNKWPPKYEIRKAAWLERGFYKCAGYLKKAHKVPASIVIKGVRKNNVFVDHIVPIIDPKVGFVDWNTVIERMFCEKENLQVLCKSCHERKSNDERAIARTTSR